MRVRVSVSRISYLPTSDRLPWEMGPPCVASLGKELSTKQGYKNILKLSFVPWHYFSLFVIWSLSTVAEFQGIAESIEVSSLKRLRCVCFPLWASERSSGFQLTVPSAELLTLYPLPLPRPLLLSLTLSLCIWMPPFGFQLQYMTASMSVKRWWTLCLDKCI